MSSAATSNGQKAFTDKYRHHDYYGVDDLLTEEHKLIRETVRSFVKRELTPIIEDYAQRAAFPKQLIKGLGEEVLLVPPFPQNMAVPV